MGDAYRAPRNLVAGLDIDRFENNRSATHVESSFELSQWSKLDWIHSAVADLWPHLTLLERAVWTFRYGTGRPWTLREIAQLVRRSKDTVNRCEIRLLRLIRCHIMRQNADGVRGHCADPAAGER